MCTRTRRIKVLGDDLNNQVQTCLANSIGFLTDGACLFAFLYLGTGVKIWPLFLKPQLPMFKEIFLIFSCKRWRKKDVPDRAKQTTTNQTKKSTGKKQQETKLLHWEHGRNISVGMHYLTGIECWSFKCQHPTGSIYIFVRHVCVYAFYVSLFSAVFLPCMNCLWLRC